MHLIKHRIARNTNPVAPINARFLPITFHDQGETVGYPGKENEGGISESNAP